MAVPESAPTNLIQRVAEILRSSAKPLSFAQLKKATRWKDDRLKTAIESAVEQAAVFRWPDRRRSQYFWTKAAERCAEEAALSLASETAMSRTKLAERACARVPGFPQKDMLRIVSNLAAGRALQAVPAFTAGKLLIRAGSTAAYSRAARAFIEEKFRKAGLSPESLFAAAPPARQVDVPGEILALIRSMEPITGVPVTTQRLRRRMASVAKEEFDAAALELNKRQEVSLSLHHDPYNVTEAERELLIDAKDGNYYVAVAIRR